MRPKDLAILFMLASIWGASFLFMRVAAPVLGPFLLIDVRVLLAGLALLAYAVAAGRSPHLRANWRGYLLLGTLNAAIPFTLIAAAELHLTASLAAILNATTPLCTALVSALWLKERLTGKKVAGLVAGLFGVAVLVGWSPIPVTKALVLSAGASLLAAISYGIGGVYVKRSFAGVPALTMTIGQQLGAGIVLLPGAVVTVPARLPSMTVVLCVLGLSLVCTALAYLFYFDLIHRVGPVKTLSVTFLVPFFGVLWGYLLLGERPAAATLLGLGIILASIMLVTEVRIRPVSSPLPATPSDPGRPCPRPGASSD